MRLPSRHDVAAELRAVNAEAFDGECDVRLQVYENGGWAVRFGDPGYDQDHHGYWGSDVVPGRGKRFNSTAMAQDLLDQVKDDYYSR